MGRIKVAVSPFFGGESWTDELTNITFEKNPRGLNVYSIPDNLDLTNIKKAIRLNTLILVEGNIGDFNEVEEVVIEASKVEEKKEEVKEEKVEKKEAAPKTQAKKTTTRRRTTTKKTEAKKESTEKTE